MRKFFNLLLYLFSFVSIFLINDIVDKGDYYFVDFFLSGVELVLN